MHDDDRERLAEEFCYRYLGFWLVVCLAAVFVFGWPILLTWVGAAWGLLTVLRVLLNRGDDSPPDRSRHPPCQKHR